MSLTLRGEMRNPAFVRYVRQFAAEELVSLSTEDWQTLDLLSREEEICLFDKFSAKK